MKHINFVLKNEGLLGHNKRCSKNRKISLSFECLSPSKISKII